MSFQATRNVDNLTAIFQTIGSNMSNFYSSRPKSSSQRACSCQNTESSNRQEIDFYVHQQTMITKTCQILNQPTRSEEQRMFSQILMLSVDYIHKIVEFLKRKTICECKEAAIREIASMKQKMGFLRDENEKIFRLYEEQSLQCHMLRSNLKELNQRLFQNRRYQTQSDIRPISARKCLQNISDQPILFPNSVHSANEPSLSCSQISECPGTIYLRQNMNLTPRKKLMPNPINSNWVKSDKKSRIFGEKSGLMQSHLY